MVINVIRSYDFPDLLRQTPGRKGIWKGHRFVMNQKKDFDLLICLNPPKIQLSPKLPKENCWLFTQEPPNHHTQWYTHAFPYFGRVFSQHAHREHSNLEQQQTCLPWHIGRNFDQLSALPPNDKKELTSAVISTDAELPGQMARLRFLAYLDQHHFPYTRFGKGFRFIKDKFDALHPFQYSLALENSFLPHYWTEKLSDCFLSWTMPIYGGCTNITDYFPPESMITIDLNDFPKSLEIIRTAIADQRWKKNLDAIEFARNLVLEKYQFFPFVQDQINKNNPVCSSPDFKPHYIPSLWPSTSTTEKWRQYFRQKLGSLRRTQ